MKRTALILVALFLLPALPAEAAEQNARPRIRIARIVAHPTPDSEVVEHSITVKAMDPDGFVTEVAVDFGDGGMVWLLLDCNPDVMQPGDPVTLELSWYYAPGKYKVTALGYSTARCDGGAFQETRRVKRGLVVR